MTLTDGTSRWSGPWRTACACVATALISGCVVLEPPPAPVVGLRYVYVVLGVDGQPVARAITGDAACPGIDFDGAALPMDVRARPITTPARSRAPLGASKPAVFPVLTCEKVVPAGVVRASIAGRALPLPQPDPQRIAILGDTGCRLLIYAAGWQACNDTVAWPFKGVADGAAGTSPDLVLHVGDYHYREDPCPAGNAGCAGSPWGYGWDAWEADFFAPAEKLLAAAPWIVVRGNHEICSRAGQGWWRFLDPRPFNARQSCDDPADDGIGNYSAPYAVPLGAGRASDTQFIVFDSSVTGYEKLTPSDAMYRAYSPQFEAAFTLAARKPENFFVDHHPILGFATNPEKPAEPYPGNAALQSVMNAFYPTVLFPPNVLATFAGHNHLLEVVSFSTPHPAQFVFGNGGDFADVPLRLPLPPGTTPAPGAVVAGIVALSPFGYTTMGRDGAGWKLVARDVRGGLMTTCALAGKRASCST